MSEGNSTKGCRRANQQITQDRHRATGCLGATAGKVQIVIRDRQHCLCDQRIVVNRIRRGRGGIEKAGSYCKSSCDPEYRTGAQLQLRAIERYVKQVGGAG